jgi:7-cyano-7-deazaguanine synthase
MSSGTILILSGGQDSTTVLFYARQQYSDSPVHAITFDYGQRHSREIDAARIVARLAGVASHEVLELPLDILKGTSPLISQEPLEQYADHRSLPGGLEKTFVPMRNQLFLTVAFNRAVCLGARRILIGVSQEDYGGYPDCRREFVKWAERASNIGLGLTQLSTPAQGYIEVETPLMSLSKAESVELALKLPGCYEALAFSHTSYDGEYPPLGKDHATLLRAKGFEEANVPDPLILRAVYENRMQLPNSPTYRQNPDIADFYGRVAEAVDRERAYRRREAEQGQFPAYEKRGREGV